MDVLVLGGGRTDDETRVIAPGVEHRALLPYRGRPMIEHVLNAVRHLGDPIVVADFEVPNARRVPAGQSFVGSLSAGLSEVRSDTFLLVTSDIPWVNAEALDDYLRRSDPQNLLNYPIIAAADAERRFPGTKRTTLKLKEGEFTGGNVALMRTELMRNAMPHMERAYANRKKVLSLGAQIGWGTLFSLIKLKLMPGSVSIQAFEQSMSKFMGGPIRAVITPYAELGTDVDSAEQYRALLAQESD